MIERQDFSGESVRTRLPVAIHFKPDLSNERVVLTEASIRRLFSPDTASLKYTLSKIPTNSAMGLMLVAKAYVDLSVETYYDASGTEYSKASTTKLNNQLPFPSLLHLFYWTMMLLKGTDLVTTSYKCRGCGKGNINDLDPDSPIPDKIEPERGLMQHFLDYMTLKHTTQRCYTYKFKFPIYIEGMEDTLEEPSAELPPGAAPQVVDPHKGKLAVYSVTNRHTVLADYMRSTSDSIQEVDPEGYALFDSIESINDLSVEDTKILKAKNGYKEMFRKLRDEDRDGMIAKLNEFALVINKHDYECRLCGVPNRSEFDQTNFFVRPKG